MSAPSIEGITELAEGGKNDEAARQLEAYFLRRVLSEVKIGQSGMLSGGFAGETFQQMFNDAIADAMAEAGGLGISDVIMGQLEGDIAEISAAPPPRSRANQIGALGFAPGGALAAPVAGPTSSSFGSRIHPVTGDRKFHAGLDIAATTGTDVAAAATGVVTRAESAGGYGNLVVVKHSGGLETRYAHLSRIDVAVGDNVAVGQTVGAVGQSGTATGPHLHFEVRHHGRARDPAEILDGRQPLNPADLLTNHKLQKKDAGTP